MLTPFGDGLWLAEGPAVTGAGGFRFPTRMAVIRLADGGLFLWSPVALGPALRAEVEALGPVRHLVAPNSLHHLALPDWHAAFPEARLHAAPGLRARRPDIAFDADLGDAPDPAWAGQIAQVVMRGNRITTEIVFFHAASATVLVTDLIQHLPRGWFTGWRALVARLDLMTAPQPEMPRKFRMAFGDRAAARAAARQMLDWPSRALVIAHGPPMPEGGRAALAHAFGWLRP